MKTINILVFLAIVLFDFLIGVIIYGPITIIFWQTYSKYSIVFICVAIIFFIDILLVITGILLLKIKDNFERNFNVANSIISARIISILTFSVVILLDFLIAVIIYQPITVLFWWIYSEYYIVSICVAIIFSIDVLIIIIGFLLIELKNYFNKLKVK